MDVDNVVEEKDLLLRGHFLVHFPDLNATVLAPSAYYQVHDHYVV